MYNENMEALISAALADGILTEKEKNVLFKRAQKEGIDLDEFEMVLDARLVELQKAEIEKAEKSAPKSTKYGDVHKCPVCGARVPALAVSCAGCGYEFTGVDASSSAQNLSKAILGCDRSQVKEVIKNFPVPNAKHDLFDIIVFLMHRIEDETYEQKLQECIDRAKYLFPSDPLFAKVIADATKAIADATKAKAKARDIKKAKDKAGDFAFNGMGIGGLVSLLVYYWWGNAHDWGWAGWFFGLFPFLAIGEGVGAGLGFLVIQLYLMYKKVKRNNPQ